MSGPAEYVVRRYLLTCKWCTQRFTSDDKRPLCDECEPALAPPASQNEG